MRKTFETLAANIGLLLISMIICFVVGELGVRYLDIIPSSGALMFSSEALQLDANGAVRYLPNKDIRTVTVYKGEIEYDVDFHTNNFGFVDYKDYEMETDPDKRYYAFVGDSFTAGFHGGEPWVPNLYKDIKDNGIEIYNLGVSGTGLEHFYRLLQSVRAQLRITHIVILAITDDLLRGFWYPLTNTSDIRFCREDERETECSEHPAKAKVIPPESTHEDILRIADDMASERMNSPITIRTFLKQSELLVFIGRAVRKFMDKYDYEYIETSLKSLRNIRFKFPLAEIHLIHLPQKQEVTKGNYFVEHIGKSISEMGILYFPALKECEWSERMFYTQDGHPNSLGYENITECVSSYLFADKKGGSRNHSLSPTVEADR